MQLVDFWKQKTQIGHVCLVDLASSFKSIGVSRSNGFTAGESSDTRRSQPTASRQGQNPGSCGPCSRIKATTQTATVKTTAFMARPRVNSRTGTPLRTDLCHAPGIPQSTPRRTYRTPTTIMLHTILNCKLNRTTPEARLQAVRQLVG